MDGTVYANNPAMARRYVELNNLTHIMVGKNLDNKYIVWEMTINHVGFGTETFKRKRDAYTYAKKLSAVLSLPIK